RRARPARRSRPASRAARSAAARPARRGGALPRDRSVAHSPGPGARVVITTKSRRGRGASARLPGRNDMSSPEVASPTRTVTSAGAADDEMQAFLQKTSRTFALTIPMLPTGLRREIGVAYLLFRII